MSRTGRETGNGAKSEILLTRLTLPTSRASSWQARSTRRITGQEGKIMPAEDSKVDAMQWYAAVQRWMAEFWHMKPDAPGQPPTADTPSR